MDGNRLSSKEPSTEGGSETPTLKSYTEVFREMFPFYLAIGMSADDYWNGEADLTKYYRQAEKLRNEKANREMWLQGYYFYGALCAASPLFHDLAKKGTKASPYMESPFCINEEEKQREEERKAKAIAEKGKRLLAALMNGKKEGDDSG